MSLGGFFAELSEGPVRIQPVAQRADDAAPLAGRMMVVRRRAERYFVLNE